MAQRIAQTNACRDRLVARLSVPLACLAVAGPAGLSVAADPVVSLYEQRNRLVVRQNYDLSCGAAALATLLVFQHGETLGERDVALGLVSRDIYLENPELLRSRRGFSLLDMHRYVARLGYDGEGLGRLRIEDLDALAPIIVALDIAGYRHFVVYRGRFANRVLLADPAYGTRTMQLSRFMRAWIRFPDLGRVGFRVTRRDNLIPPDRLRPRAEDFPTLH